MYSVSLLIEPYGIEIMLTNEETIVNGILLIEPYGIEMIFLVCNICILLVF